MGRSGCCNRDRVSIETLTDHCIRVYGQSPLEWGPDIAYLTIEPSWFVGFAMTDAELAEIEAQKAERAANADSQTDSAQPAESREPAPGLRRTQPRDATAAPPG